MQYINTFIYPSTSDHGVTHHREVMQVFIDIHGNQDTLHNEVARWNKTAQLIAVHDCFDHKYPELREQNRKIAAEHNMIWVADAADKLSWSKRHLYTDLNDIENTARYCDWVTAIDLQRCIDFVRNHLNISGEELTKAVVDHAHEKLVKIIDVLPEPYKTYAMPRHIKLLEDLANI